jgi:hypothetical protein
MIRIGDKMSLYKYRNQAMTAKEISEVTGYSMTAVDNYTKRAVEKLRRNPRYRALYEMISGSRSNNLGTLAKDEY